MFRLVGWIHSWQYQLGTINYLTVYHDTIDVKLHIKGSFSFLVYTLKSFLPSLHLLGMHFLHFVHENEDGKLEGINWVMCCQKGRGVVKNSGVDPCGVCGAQWNASKMQEIGAQ